MRRVLVLIFCLLLVGPLWAAQSPRDLVADTTDRIVTKLRAEQDAIKANQGRLYEIVDEVVLPHFDFEAMSSWVLGKYWRGADAEQRKRFTAEFKTLLVRTYAKALNDNYDRKIDILPMRGDASTGDVTIHTEVQQNAGFPIPIDYSMHLKDGAWKVYDVSVDGVSLVTNYRASFAKEIRADGLPKLIARLAERNQQAANE